MLKLAAGAIQLNSLTNSEMIRQQLYLCHSTVNSPSRRGIIPVTVTTQVVSTPSLKSSAVRLTLEKWSDWLFACGETNCTAKTPDSAIAARFHKGLTMIIAAMVDRLATQCATNSPLFTAVALSGGCLQNKVLLEEVS